MKPDVVLPFQGVGESGVPCSKGVAPGYVVMPLWGVRKWNASPGPEDRNSVPRKLVPYESNSARFGKEICPRLVGVRDWMAD